MADLGPESILRFEFTPGIEIGFLPQQAEWGSTSLMKMGFLPKQGTSFLPYNVEDLAVVGESPPVVKLAPTEETPLAPTTPTTPTSPPATTPPTTPTTTAPTTTATTPTPATPVTTTPVVSGLVRPHGSLITLVSRITPRHYLAGGLAFGLYLDAPAKITAQIAASFKMGPGKATEHTISKQASRTLPSGFYEISLMPDTTASLALKRHKKLIAKAVVKVLYEDNTNQQLEKEFMIATTPPPLK